MNKPAILDIARATLGKLAATGKGFASKVGQGVHKAGDAISGLTGRVSEGTRRIILIGVVSAATLIVMVILAGILVSALSGRKTETVPMTQTARVETASAMPRSGPALAAMLLIPEDLETPYPLALEPKARYTEADAAAVRPYVGDIDVSEFTSRRKAELEAIFGAVD